MVKFLLERHFPAFYLSLSSSRARARSERLEREWGCTTLTHKLLRNYGPGVLDGPFQGLRFSPNTFGRHLAPKLLGSYECELHPVWERVRQQDYSSILDIGSAEGYYTVGLARNFPRAPVHAFDTDSWARETVQQMAKTNHVNNVHVHGSCSVAWLSENLRPNSFILSDCEGYEATLFRPDLVQNMKRCDILIELHEQQAPGVTERLRERFKPTHSCELIAQQDRPVSSFADVPFLSEDELRLALNEFRTERQEWLFLENLEKKI